jgi:parvulin-like peptidyl-prolyl isomerase
MKRPAAFWISIGIAAAAGFGGAQLAPRSVLFRDRVGTFFGRGHLLALVGSDGIYQADVDRQVAEIESAGETKAEREEVLTGLIANSAARSRGRPDKVSRIDVEHDLNLLRFQFSDEKTWKAALNRSGLSILGVAQLLKSDLRARRWISRTIASEITVADEEGRRFYDSHPHDFFLPARYRVSHLFLAAPPETSPEIVEAKQASIEALSARVAGGEDFATLAAQNSEDEATKLHGGDLGYFSATRMPPDFVEVATKLRPGEVSKPVRTRLGFHLLKLTDVQAPWQQTFDEVRGDIAIRLSNEKRVAAMQKLLVELRKDAAYLRLL